MARPKIYCRQINFAPVEDHQPAKPQDVPSRRRRRRLRTDTASGAVPQVGLEPTIERLLI